MNKFHKKGVHLKKVSVLFIFVSLILFLYSFDYLDLNFFIEPKFDDSNLDKENFILENTINDSIIQINIFAGKILKNAESDSSVIAFLDSVNCQYACPTDYFFYEGSDTLNFQIIASNIKHKQIPIIENIILQTDSISVGIFSIYSPDFTVKNEINPDSEFDCDVFQIAKEQAKYLAKKSDLVIMMSNVTKYIDEDIVSKLPVDVVVSFDYQKKKNELFFNKRTDYFSILSHRGKFGKLRLVFEKGKLDYEWLEEKIR